MPYEPDPPLKKAYTENTFLRLPGLVPADAQPLYDCEGRPIFDEEGRRIYGEE